MRAPSAKPIPPRCTAARTVQKAGIVSPPGGSRGRQGNGEGIAAQDHEGDQPSDCLFTLGGENEELGNVADRCSLSLNLAAVGDPAARSAFRAARVPASRFRSSTSAARALFAATDSFHSSWLW